MKTIFQSLLLSVVLVFGAATVANATYLVEGEGSWESTGAHSGVLSCEGEGICAQIDSWGRIDFWIDNMHYIGHCVSCSWVPPNGSSNGPSTWTIESVVDEQGNPADPS